MTGKESSAQIHIVWGCMNQPHAVTLRLAQCAFGTSALRNRAECSLLPFFIYEAPRLFEPDGRMMWNCPSAWENRTCSASRWSEQRIGRTTLLPLHPWKEKPAVAVGGKLWTKQNFKQKMQIHINTCIVQHLGRVNVDGQKSWCIWFCMVSLLAWPQFGAILPVPQFSETDQKPKGSVFTSQRAQFPHEPDQLLFWADKKWGERGWGVFEAKASWICQ